MVVMLAAVKFGLRHQLMLQTETRLGLAHKTPISNLDLFLETFVSEMMEAVRNDARFNDWLKQTVAEHYPGFRNGKRLDMPSGDYRWIPDAIQPIRQQTDGSIGTATLTSSIDTASSVVIPPGSDWRITLGYAEILHDAAYPAFHGKRHNGIDIYRLNAHKAPVHAMRGGVVIDSVYLPKGFRHTVVVEHDDGTSLRYTHLAKKLIKNGDRVLRGQRVGMVGEGAKDIYPARLHLDMPRSRQYARARSNYDTTPGMPRALLIR